MLWFFVPAASSALWTPAALGSSVLKLWLDANDISTITKDGSNYVSQWDDKSGNNNHVYQATGSYQPLFSNNSIVFDGSNDCLVASNTLSAEDVAGANRNTVMLFQLMKYVNDGHHFWCSQSNRNNRFTILGNGTFDFVSYTTGRLASWSTLISGSDFDIVACSYNGAAKTQRAAVNGTQVAIDTNDALALASSTYYISIGQPYNDNTSWFGGSETKEILLINNYDFDTLQKVEGYQAHKWGFTSKLPADHPYKTNPPTV